MIDFYIFVLFDWLCTCFLFKLESLLSKLLKNEENASLRSFYIPLTLSTIYSGFLFSPASSVVHHFKYGVQCTIYFMCNPLYTIILPPPIPFFSLPHHIPKSLSLSLSLSLYWKGSHLIEESKQNWKKNWVLSKSHKSKIPVTIAYKPISRVIQPRVIEYQAKVSRGINNSSRGGFELNSSIKIKINTTKLSKTQKLKIQPLHKKKEKNIALTQKIT